jgi:hypothetical protein
MAMVYKDQGKYDQALEIHKSVLETKIDYVATPI